MKEFLKVMLWGKEVGRLAWHESRKIAYFVFDPSFLKGNIDIAPLTASIRNPLSTRVIFGDTERIYQKLPPFIADSLPDAWGNQLFEQWRREQHLSARSVTPIEKLAFIGSRGMGAFEFVPEIERSAVTDRIDVKALADLAEKIVIERENISIMPEENLTMQSLIAVGTSAGGRQPKGIIAINSKTGEIRSGQVDVSPDFEYYILKFGNKERSLAEIEITYYEMAVRAGITMMDSNIIEVEGTRHFLTKRFDRNKEGKLHTQTLAAMLPGANSYEDLMTVCRKLYLPENDCQEVFRRMVFNILANNTDDHNKNFSFVMNQSGVWRLSPAYDLTYIFDTGGYMPNVDHCLMIGGKLRDITLDDVMSLAAEHGIKKPESIVQNVVEAIMKFRDLAEKNGVREEWIGRIENCINNHLAAWGVIKDKASLEYEESGHRICNVRIETTYKGNYHLLADIDGKEYKYILRKGKEEYEYITSIGISNISDDALKSLVRTYLINKVQ